MKTNGRVVRLADVTAKEQEEMFSLMDIYFDQMDRARFEADLAEKQWVILLQDPATQEVRGFSTMLLMDFALEQRPVKILFSGDTIIHHEDWAQNPLAKYWGQFALSLIDSLPNEELYWFLISQGYKTYRFLPLFFKEFYPRFDCSAPGWASLLITQFGQHKYPLAFCSKSGVVKGGLTGYRLRPHVASLTEQRMNDPHVRFFAGRNAGHEQGDELCCIAPLTRENFTRAAYRVIGSLPEVSGTVL